MPNPLQKLMQQGLQFFQDISSSSSNSSDSQAQLSITTNTEEDLGSRIRGSDSIVAENNSETEKEDYKLLGINNDCWVMILRYLSMRDLLRFLLASRKAAELALDKSLAYGFFRELAATISQSSHNLIPFTPIPNLIQLIQDFKNTQKPEEKQRLINIIDILLCKEDTQLVILQLFKAKGSPLNLRWQHKVEVLLKPFLQERIDFLSESTKSNSLPQRRNDALKMGSLRTITEASEEEDRKIAKEINLLINLLGLYKRLQQGLKRAVDPHTLPSLSPRG